MSEFVQAPRSSDSPAVCAPDGSQATSTRSLRHWFKEYAPIVGVLLFAAWLHAPVLRLGFIGDDYQWWQHARFALEEPSLFLAPFGGYRPALTCLLALENLAFGTSPAGYLAGGLILYLLCGGLLWAVATRLGCGRWVSAGIAALWLSSPFSIEPLLSVAPRIYLLLMACWLGLALAWPAREGRWTAGRGVLATFLVLLSLLSLETWVMLPALVMVFDLSFRSTSLRTALRHSALAALPVLVYLAAYLRSPPVDFGSYYSQGIEGAVILPHVWAAFGALTTMQPMEIGFGVREALALLMIGLCAWLGIRGRNRAVMMGFAFFVLPLLPLIPVPFLTTRYTTIPLAGFLLVAAAVGKQLFIALEARGVATRVLTAARCCVLVLVSLYFAAGLAWVQGEKTDRRRLDRLHQDLLAEAAAFSHVIPRDRILVSIRLETSNPLHQLSLTASGLPKAQYVRASDPYALIDTAALWSWVLAPRGGPLFHYPKVEPSEPSQPFVIGHREGGFMVLGEAESIEEAMSPWKGYYTRVLAPWRPGPKP